MSLSKQQKRSCVFNEDLEREFKFIKTDASTADRSKVVCKICGVHFSVAHGGRNDITQHAKTKKHRDAEKAVISSSNLQHFILKKDIDDKISAQEGMFAYHAVIHGHSFRSNDCLSKVIKKLYEPKYSLGKTKSEAIDCNVLAPLSINEVDKELSSCGSVSLSIDASNKKAEKCFPVLVRYFLPLSGVHVKMISFSSLPNEQSETQSKMLEELIKNKNLTEKIVAMCADNTSTNFGGAARKGKNNVWVHLQHSLGKEVIGVGCGAHIVHNCIQTAIDCMPFDIECFAVKVYKYFHICTVRTEELKEFCDFAGVEYSKLLEHRNTRFLYLGPAITRILKIFEGLKSYFLSQEKCPYFLSQLFENPCFNKPWLMFATFQISTQISTFEDAVLKIEKDNISATEVAWRITSLKSVMKSREEEGFIPTNVKTLILNLQEEGELTVQDFTATVTKFYKTCVDYLDKWEWSFGGVHNLQWILLQTVPSWSDIQTSLSNFNARQIKEISEDQDKETKLFDQWQCVKDIVSENIKEWNRVDKTKVKTPVEERWKHIFARLNSEDIACDAILKVVEFALCLPGTSAPVERVFSIMNNLWSSEKSRLDVMTMSSMLMVRVNFKYTCDQFYEVLLKNKDVLRKISSSQKYFWYGKEKESDEQAGPSNLK